MPLPRYQPVKKRPKIMGPTLNDLDDHCLAKIIGFALQQAKWRDQEPFVGDNGVTERNLSLVSKRWYFLTQTQLADHGVHKIDLDEALIRGSQLQSAPPQGAISTVKTPRRTMVAGVGPATAARTPVGSFRMRPNYGVLSQRNMTTTSTSTQQRQQVKNGPADGYDIRLFRALQPKLLKYKHVQLSGTITGDNFSKLLIALDSSRVEQLDLLGVKVEAAKSCLSNPNSSSGNNFKPLIHLDKLTYTISSNSKDDATNALLWTIYQQAINLKELRVYLFESSKSHLAVDRASGNQTEEGNDWQVNSASFIERLSAMAIVQASHSQLKRVVFRRISPGPNSEQQCTTTAEFARCKYSQLIKRLLSEEKSIASLDTNDPSLVFFLIQSSSRLCTKLNLRSLTLTCFIDSLDLLLQLIKLQNLGTDYLSLVLDNFDQIGEVRAIVENFKLNRPELAKCVVNLYLRDQKYSDCEDKVKNLIQLGRLADINVHISALQRISIDCCHLMWSTGRALQALAADPPGRCIFRITLQTYPVRPNTVNPFEITIPFGKCLQYKISSSREDLVRHREIMKSLKKDCYHQFVKSVRENNTP